MMPKALLPLQILLAQIDPKNLVKNPCRDLDCKSPSSANYKLTTPYLRTFDTCNRDVDQTLSKPYIRLS